MARFGRQAIHLVAVTTLGISAAAVSPAAQAAQAPGSAATAAGRAAQLKSPNPGSTDNELDGVSADSATDAWAVGWARDLDKFQTYHSLTLHWDGTSWSLVPNPDPFGGDGGTSQLFAVSAVSPTDTWAVGTCTCLGTDTNQTLIMHWDGTAWSQV